MIIHELLMANNINISDQFSGTNFLKLKMCSDVFVKEKMSVFNEHKR